MTGHAGLTFEHRLEAERQASWAACVAAVGAERVQVNAYGLVEIVDPDGYERWRATVGQRYGGFPPDARAELAFRDLARYANESWHDEVKRAHYQYVWRRMDEAWDDYRVSLGFSGCVWRAG